MTKKQANIGTENTIPLNKSAMMVSIFMATALVGCGQTTTPPQKTPASPAQQTASTQTTANQDAPPYGGTIIDYCRDDNGDGHCDDSGENYDKQYAYTHDGHPYYGRSGAVTSGVIAAGALAGAALGAAAMTAGKPTQPIPSTPPSVSLPVTSVDPKKTPPSMGTGTPSTGTAAPTTSSRTGSFSTGSGSQTDADKKSTGSTTSE
ncbi:hypothetical protein O9H85_33690 [Paenibacillus filicis]|uniref:Uncharacterized protein n=1 Tax=Paenibacillus gyeongsangnamensis TaxID=3388067 RepID=A0ABT4QK17_9BACL|nr:hypothetical protein [Paenibacillus filicis]MCZ8517217.1 hypothetical protein [Paenibacillus filicis]